MPALARGQTSNCANPQLDIFTTVSGMLVDVYSLEFQIFDVSDPVKLASPVQVYPATLGARQAVNVTILCPNVGAGKISTGRFFANWTPPVSPAEPLGTHRVKWFFKLTSTSPEQTFQEDFEVLAEVSGSGETGYCFVQDLRDEGVTVAMASDDRLLKVISLASRMIDRITQRWFEPRARTWLLDGPGTPSLLIEVPIIGISEIKVNDTAIDLADVRIYNRHLTSGLLHPDDREDPRVIWNTSDRRHVYPYGSRRSSFGWSIGTQNVEVSGVFGYTDYDGSNPNGITPELIRHACVLMVLREFRPLASDDYFDAQQRYRLTSERTRDQSYSLSAPRGAGGPRDGLWTGDPAIDDILASYVAPMRMGATSP